MRRTTVAGLVPALVVLALSACTSRVAGTGSAAENPRPDTSTPSSTPSSSSSPAPTPPKDGTDVTACADADCEIALTGAATIPLDPAFGCESFVVTYTTPNKVSVNAVRTEISSVDAYIMGTGHIGLANGVKITVERIDDKGAVLRFTPETMDPTSDVTAGSEGAGSYN